VVCVYVCVVCVCVCVVCVCVVCMCVVCVCVCDCASFYTRSADQVYEFYVDMKLGVSY